MKRRIGLLFAVILYISPLLAQNDILNNGSIIKMTQAKLSDELIINVIKDSDTGFDLGNAGISGLRNAGVTEAVIEAMNNAMVSGGNTAAMHDSGAGMRALRVTGPVEAFGYVTPVAALVTYYEDEFRSMAATVAEWNGMITGSLDEINRLNAEISSMEGKLAEMKNADANRYSEEIINLRKNLRLAREKHEELKENMRADGDEIAEKLLAISSQRVKSAGKQHASVSQRIKSAGGDPASPGSPVTVEPAELSIPAGLNTYINPVNEIFYWYLNEIEDIGKIIADWNVKVENALAGYEALKTKLDPVEQQLAEYEKSPKQYKTEISELKDQQSAIGKEIKVLEKEMENDNNELSAFIKGYGEKIGEIFAERIADIVAGINFLYHQKLNV